MPLRCEFARAMSTDELYLKFQPVVEFSNGRIHSFEALLRWQHPIYGHLPARDFAFALRDPTLQGPLSRFVMHEALQAQSRWSAVLGQLPVSVNLSPSWIASTEFIDLLRELATTSNLRTGGGLLVEIVETDILRPTPTLLAHLHAATELGVAFLLDDFGTGYTSIGELRDLPLQGLKIDRQYVQRLMRRREDTAVMLGLLYMAQGFGLTAIAEGVENYDQAALLRQLGCDLMQGNGLCPPLAEDELSYLPATTIPSAAWPEAMDPAQSRSCPYAP
jgi:EAL domain-containing protein (putative c-di-GMP-specific phosphodiesterase class I)